MDAFDELRNKRMLFLFDGQLHWSQAYLKNNEKSQMYIVYFHVKRRCELRYPSNVFVDSASDLGNLTSIRRAVHISSHGNTDISPSQMRCPYLYANTSSNCFLFVQGADHAGCRDAWRYWIASEGL